MLEPKNLTNLGLRYEDLRGKVVTDGVTYFRPTLQSSLAHLSAFQHVREVKWRFTAALKHTLFPISA